MSSASALVFAGLCGAVLAAVMGAYGFQGRAVVVGVDLGTTFSAVAVNARHHVSVAAAMGGRVSIPSIIALVNGSFLVGEAAAPLLTSDPWRAVFDAKRVIGRRAPDPLVAMENLRHRGRIVPHPYVYRNHFGKPVSRHKLAGCAGCASDLAFVLRVPESEQGTLARAASHPCVDRGSLLPSTALAQHLAATGYAGASAELGSDAPGRQYLLLTPQAAACLVVEELMRQVRASLGHSTIAGVVAATPADFNAMQRAATLEAYSRNRLSVSRVLFEPAAAAIAYGLHRDPLVRYVVVFDMGGGTTDVSVLYLQDGAFTVIGSAGDGHLGGEDFDDCLVRVMARRLEAEGVPGAAAIAQAGGGGGGDGGGEGLAPPSAPRGCHLAWLKREAERIKIGLSDTPSADTQISWACELPSGRTLRSGVSRAVFEHECDAMFARTLAPVRDALAYANLGEREVNEVVLVGGSSRLPRVRGLLQQLFNLPGLRATVDPDLAVAVGAALVVD